jgi:hypothetical protein
VSVETGPPTKAVGLFVGVILALLVVAALMGFEAWPLTEWRLFSLARGADQTHWEIDAITADGARIPVDLDRLPMAYHLAEWPMAELPDEDDARRDDVCGALLEGVRQEIPDAMGLRVVRNRQRMVNRDGSWVVIGDREPFHSCADDGDAP